MALDIAKYKNKGLLKARYEGQLQRLHNQGIPTACIEHAVTGAIENLPKANNAALVIYGEPQSGKTEMMICLTAKLLDSGHKIIVHLMNDSVDLLSQNLRRFKKSGLAPAAKNFSEIVDSGGDLSKSEHVIFCKKNGKDLAKLIERLKNAGPVVVIDDEADYATPNSKVNKGGKTPINDLIGKLLGENGSYIGVTATPARLDLNNTFGNDTEKWVDFPPHDKYTGQDTFFPLDKKVHYRLRLLKDGDIATNARVAPLRFLVTAAYLNTHINGKEENYTFLVHTSGRKQDHEADRATIEGAAGALADTSGEDFDQLVQRAADIAIELYPKADHEVIIDYLVMNASRITTVVLNSERDRAAAGESATEPTSPFTIIIGGNIVSRGVTFPNLLSMYFTRGVKHKLQQDTYIQRARMFGARGSYLEHFELTIPDALYSDWHRCFVFHKLALATVKSGIGSPVWVSDGRVAVASDASIDKATVSFDSGEMSFQSFAYSKDIEPLIHEGQSDIATLHKLQVKLGKDVLPKFLVDFIENVQSAPGSLAIHHSASISKWADADKEKIWRRRGFIGKSQRQIKKFPNAVHHIKIHFNDAGRAKLMYRYAAGATFIHNLGAAVLD